MPAFSPNLSLEELAQVASAIRQQIVDVLQETGKGHSAGALGMVDMFVSLYYQVLTHDPDNHEWPQRDRLFLSNGHTCAVLYATLAKCGYFPTEELYTLRELGSRLQGHPHRGSLPGVEITSGPLGQGLSKGAGLATAFKMDQLPNRVFVIMGDGEQQEGQNWEAYWYAGVNQLSNLSVLIDRNHIQIDGPTDSVLPLEPLQDKLESFNWQVSTVDGHDIAEITQAASLKTSHPHAIICHTIPGKGVDFMENDYTWHGKAPSPAEAIDAISQLRKSV